MTYRIVGADGQTYGPVGPEEIRQWIAQRRVDARTPALPAGAAGWTYLGLLPEFADGFASPPPPPPPPPPPAIGAVGSNVPSVPGTNNFALAGLVCGLLSWACCGCCPFNLLGAVFPIIALVQLRGQPGQTGRGLAIAGLVLSVTSLIFGLVAVILNAVLNPETWSANPF